MVYTGLTQYWFTRSVINTDQKETVEFSHVFNVIVFNDDLLNMH